MSKYIYADLGAYNGDTYLNFMSSDDLPVAPEEFKVYLFEPNPKFKRILNTLKDKFDNIIEVSDKAAWIEDTEKQLALDTNDLAYGSTLMPSKIEIWEKFDKINVLAFNFSEWVKQFKDDYLIVKMDTEGSEFPILMKMLNDGTAKYMNELWVEMHPNKVTDYTTTFSEELISKIEEEVDKVKLWH